MTKKQKEQFNKMRRALKTISKEYMTPAQINRHCEKSFGLGYIESLEGSYENIQLAAKNAAKGVRGIK